jgi:subtilisin family serine protease
MQPVKTTISGAALCGVSLAAALVLASAPAASPPTAARPLLTGQAARTVAPATTETTKGLWSQISGARASTRATRVPGIEVFTPNAVRGARVRVVIETHDVASARAAVRATGGRVERSAKGLVQALVSNSELERLEQRPGVDRVRAPYTRIENAVSGEEVSTALASAWHQQGFTGKGVKVAIIDGGFTGLTDRQAAGELPANVVTQDLCGGELASAGRHGTAVAEIVHEMAPDAQLYLICVGTEVDFVNAVGYAKSQGVSVVNQSMGWEGPYRDDGSGPIGAAVADARASGILWVNSAGNEAMTHWSGTYAPVGPPVHKWSPNGDIGNTFVWPNDTAICGFLKWDEWPAAASDFDLVLALSGTNELIDASAGDQGGGQPPFEALCMYQSTGQDLVVFWAVVGYRVVSSPRLDLVSWSPPLEYFVPAGSIASPATSPAAMAVGALCWQSRSLEPYSSQGPTIDGRVKPDIVGHDSVSGGTYGGFSSCPSAFAGTSASSPEVAGAAALVKQAYPKYTPDQLKAYLMDAARDLGDPGVDNVYGAGELQLPKPPDFVAPTATALAGTGRKGHTAKLLSRISDDSGEVGLFEEVKLHGKVVARFKQVWFSSAARGRTVGTAWKVPATASGTYQHCVRAIDRAGNKTAPSCARVRIT